MILGVISDTHIPDRARGLHPRVIPTFREAGVEAILHAGDVSASRVLNELGRVAPVYAVRGNRDWVALRQLPPERRLAFHGVQVALAHGHGSLMNYLVDRVGYILGGYRLEMFLPRLLAAFPEARVIVFGHTHRPLCQWIDGKLIFNPGSPHFPDKEVDVHSVGLLHIRPDGEVRGEIVRLE